MIRLAINHEAWVALGGDPAVPGPHHIWLPRETVKQLERVRGSAESWSDLILRAAKELT